MPLLARFALALAVSLAASGAVQQAIMVADGATGTASALLPLSPIVLLVTVVFTIVMWLRPTAIALSTTAVTLLSVMLAVGATVYILGRLSWAPDLGGNIVYGIALLVDFYFLLPAAVAVPVHWHLLRGATLPHADDLR